MAHESFEDEEIAKIMNENFINIKVDREERPDIDDIYQRVSQLAIGTGGWPLSVFLTPDQKPFYVGTYFPKYGRYGMPGFGTILSKRLILQQRSFYKRWNTPQKMFNNPTVLSLIVQFWTRRPLGYYK
jgi:uncharacterized protein YyaL (SSP411 family)